MKSSIVIAYCKKRRRPVSSGHRRLDLITLLLGIGILVSPNNGLSAPGDLYETNYEGQSVRRFAPNGTSATFTMGFAANGIAFDANKNLFVTDWDLGIIYKFAPDGTRTTFATGLSNPYALAFDSAGNLFETDFGTSRVYKFAPDGTKTIFATVSFAGGMVFGKDGSLYVGGFGSQAGPNPTIYKIAPDGTKTVLINSVTSTGGIAIDSAGNFFVADYRSSLLYKYTPAGTKTIYSRDVNKPEGLLLDSADNLFVADWGNSRILKFTPDGQESIFASGLTGVTLMAFEPSAPAPQARELLNISTRLRVLTGDKVLIGGFIITGNEPKKVLIRGLGPSLSDFGIQSAMGDPSLELHQGDATIAGNDNWKEHQADVEATTIPPRNDLESAIVTTLAPGAYTAILSDHNGGSGVGVVEVYDLNQAADSTLANISTRGFVGSGDNAMIGGLIVGGNSGDTMKVVVRAIGPSLTDHGVSGALLDPTLELHDGNGAKIAENDNWKTDHQAEIEATQLAPNNDKESALVQTVTPGSYTAIVRGASDSTGVALVEVYRVN